MTILSQIQFLVALTLEEVRNHPQHELPFERRATIYDALRSVNPSKESGQLPLTAERKRVARLAIISARKVLPVWEATSAAKARNDSLETPQGMLLLAERVLEGISPKEAAVTLLDEAEDVYASLNFDKIGSRARFSFLAAKAALKIVLGQDIMSESDDVTWYALRAFIAPPQSSVHESYLYHKKRRLEFWAWWLRDAIPAAWGASEFRLMDSKPLSPAVHERLSTLPAPISSLITSALERVQQHPLHRLPLLQRIKLYQAFGQEIDLSGHLFEQLVTNNQFQFTPAQRGYAKLAIISAQKVLPVWEAAVPALLANAPERSEMISTPERMIEMAQRALEGTGSPKEAIVALSDEYYHFLATLAPDEVGIRASYALKAAIAALKMVLGQGVLKKSDDVALCAERADACLWISRPTPYSSSELQADEFHLYDYKKRLQFWQWWLTEAIPAAWALSSE